MARRRDDSATARRTVARALEIAGSEEVLARFLRVRAADLRAWAAGDKAPPLRVFFELVDVVAANVITRSVLDHALNGGRPKVIRLPNGRKSTAIVPYQPPSSKKPSRKPG